jgi:hypothetical protein
VPLYVISQSRIDDRDEPNDCARKAVETISAGEGRSIAFDESPEVVEGVPG